MGDSSISTAPRSFPFLRCSYCLSSAAAQRLHSNELDESLKGTLPVVTAEKFAESISTVEVSAADAGRTAVNWRHGLQVWCGFGSSRATARPQLAETMERLYKLPFEKFERWSPCGTAADVAEFLQPYVHVGCREFNLIAVADSDRETIEGVAEVRRLLRIERR